MRFLFDQNISHRVLKLIPQEYIGSTTIKTEGLINATDREIWEFAKNNEYIIVTQDSDFNDLNSLFGFPPKLIWIRTGNMKTQSIADIIVDYADEINKFMSDSQYGCFEIFKLKPF